MKILTGEGINHAVSHLVSPGHLQVIVASQAGLASHEAGNGHRLVDGLTIPLQVGEDIVGGV